MVSQLQQVVVQYIGTRDDGGPNRLFFAYLFGDALPISFLQDAKLIRSQVLCDSCGRFMKCCADPRAT